MDEPLNALSHLLTNLVLPTLRAVQNNQSRQFDENEALNNAITELRNYINLQFNQIQAQLEKYLEQLRAIDDALLILKLELTAVSQKQRNLIH